MAVIIDTPTIHKSIAQILSQIDSTATIFDNPNQQGTKLPAWFIVHRTPVSITPEINNRFFLVYSIDIYYMLEYNLPRLYDQYTDIADQLDLALVYLPIYNGDGALIHVYERNWELALNALKYSITLRIRVTPQVEREPYMRVIESLDVFIKTAFPLIRVYFTNTSHPELGIDIPNQMFCYYGDTMVLPTIEGIYRDAENHRWQPVAWTLGGFGETIGPLYQNTTTNLIVERVYGYEAPMGGTIGDKSSTSNFVKIVEMDPNYEPDYRHAGILSIDGVETGNADMALVHEPDYAYSGTVTNEPMVFGGTVEPWTPPTTDKTAYFTQQGSSASGNSYIRVIDYPYLYDASGNNIPYDSSKTYTIVEIQQYDGTVLQDIQATISGDATGLIFHQNSGKLNMYLIKYTEA